MAITALNATGGLPVGISSLKEQLAELQVQLGTGKRATTYGGLGASSSFALGYRAEISTLEGYKTTINTVSLRLSLVDSSLQRVQEIADETRSSLLSASYEPGASGLTLSQFGAEAKLSELVSLYNGQVAGHHLFAGRASEAPPVVSDTLILDGAPGQAGFNQVLSERRSADLGADDLGRLSLPVPAGASVALSEDAAGHPFGYKLTAVTSSLTGTTVTGPTGAPNSLQVDFTATLPVEGETISIGVALPDGTTSEFALTATSTSPPGDGEFTIGVDENETALNFQAALTSQIESVSHTELAAASALEAADNFFDYDSTTAPQRVDGPPFDTATGLRDATSADTVFWYQGDLASEPRSSAVAKVDDSLSVAYGARADEAALRTVIKQTSLLAAERFDAAVESDADRYAALSERIVDQLSPTGGGSLLSDIMVELSYKHVVVDRADQRHDESLAFVKDNLANAEGVDLDEVAVNILRLQTQLQASFETTSLLSRLSLVNFI